MKLAITVSIYVISAMCGNWMQESGVNPGIWQNLSVGNWDDLLKGYGIGQWTNTMGDRHGVLWQLHEYMVDNGYPMDSGYGQLEYFLYNKWWNKHAESEPYKTLDEFLASDSTNIAHLTHAFNRGWEGIHDSSWDKRVDYAWECYDYILEHYNDEGITDWVAGNRYLSKTESLNNAVLVYRYFNGEGPGPGPGPSPEPIKSTGKIFLWLKPVLK